jgi:hypothetical protein
MRAITPGHRYALENFEGGNEAQSLQFIEKDAAMNTVNDGTTNEEVLLMLIDRLKFLGDRLPSRENSIAITKCEEALLWLNKRTADRKARGVEGTSKA